MVNDTLLWQEAELATCFVDVCVPKVMINRDSWRHLYLCVRGEILGAVKDEPQRKHLPRMFSLIKNER